MPTQLHTHTHTHTHTRTHAHKHTHTHLKIMQIQTYCNILHEWQMSSFIKGNEFDFVSICLADGEKCLTTPSLYRVIVILFLLQKSSTKPKSVFMCNRRAHCQWLQFLMIVDKINLTCSYFKTPRWKKKKVKRDRSNSVSFGRLVVLILKDQWGWF